MEVTTHQVGSAADGHVPPPLVVYRQVLDPKEGDLPSRFEALFQSHGWTGCWRNGVFPFDHFHSTAHEVLGIYEGTARLIFGGPGGLEIEALPGDALVIPAGVLHRRMGGRGQFGVVGAYPSGQQPDTCEAGRGDQRWRAARMAEVSLPTTCPIAGADGPLIRSWGS